MLEKLLTGYNADALPSNLVCVHIKSIGHNGAKDEIKMPEGPQAGSRDSYTSGWNHLFAFTFPDSCG